MNYLGLLPEQTAGVVRKLNVLLSNYHIYYQNLRNFHWNIDGSNFFELHEKFEDLYNDARLKIDEIAERILTLRQSPLSRYTDYLEHANITESPVLAKDHEMVNTILNNHRILIKNMRFVLKLAGDIKDEGTIDLIGGALKNLEKKSWMLDAWLARNAVRVMH